MIDGVTAQTLEQLDVRTEDVRHQFDPGYIPVLDEDRKTTGTRAVNSLDALHTTAPQDAFYAGVDAHGRRFYTRDGAFDLQSFHLRTADGSSVLGYPANAKPGSEPQPLDIDRNDYVLGNVHDAKIGEDGTFEYTRKTADPKTGAETSERVVVGRLALARFPAGTRIEAADGVHVTARAGEEPTLGMPSTEGFGTLLAHSDDRGGIDIQQGLSHLRDAFVAYTAIQSAKNAHGHTDKIAMDLIK